jgi:hypothetical protein
LASVAEQTGFIQQGHLMTLRAPAICGVPGCESVDEVLLTIMVAPVLVFTMRAQRRRPYKKQKTSSNIGHMAHRLTRSVCSHVPFAHRPIGHMAPTWAHMGPSWPIGHMAPIWGFHLPIGPYGALMGLGLYGALMGPYATWAHKTKHTVVGDLNGQDFFGAHVGHGPMIAPYTAMWYMGQ